MLIVQPLTLGWVEIVAIIVAILILFGGASKIPALMRGMGRGINEFKKGMSEKDSPDDDASNPADPRNNDDSDDGPQK